jgi:hypothetical protein
MTMLVEFSYDLYAPAYVIALSSLVAYGVLRAIKVN